MSTLQELPTLAAETPAILTMSSSMNSISTSSDDVPQLSFEYIVQDNTQPDALEATLPTNDTLLNDALGNKPTAERISPALTLHPDRSNIPFRTRGQLSQSMCWPRCEASCARETHQLKKSAKRMLRWLERTGKKRNASVKLRLRDKEKENWVSGIDAHVKGECNTSFLVEDTSIYTCLTPAPHFLWCPSSRNTSHLTRSRVATPHTAHIELPL
ncbi:hypothetical protein JB92DRAFT_3099035, partial [Gautieria morchelliformis]